MSRSVCAEGWMWKKSPGRESSSFLPLNLFCRKQRPLHDGMRLTFQSKTRSSFEGKQQSAPYCIRVHTFRSEDKSYGKVRPASKAKISLQHHLLWRLRSFCWRLTRVWESRLGLAGIPLHLVPHVSNAHEQRLKWHQPWEESSDTK